jgi:hypothetical protein
MTTEQLIQYLIDAGIPEMRANGVVNIGIVSDQTSADNYIAEMNSLGG